MDETQILIPAGRAILAWLGATTLATMVGLLLWQPSFIVFVHFALLIALPLTAVFIPLMVWTMRWLRLPRPFTDAAAGAVGGALLCSLLAVAMIPLWLAIACGALGGMTYWLLAGGPRPPYGARPEQHF